MNPFDALALDTMLRATVADAVAAGVFTLLVLVKSLSDFTRTGPQMTEEVLRHYRLYLAGSLARLAFYAFVIAFALGLTGALAYALGTLVLGAPFDAIAAAAAALAAILLLTARQFLHTLLHSPGVIASSFLYSTARLLPVWDRLTPARLRLLDALLFGVLALWLAAGAAVLASRGGWIAAAVVLVLAAAGVAAWRLAGSGPEPAPVRQAKKPGRPNILMIGSDTLRADRLGGAGYRRALTPALDRLARRATILTDCYVPCARTAPSVVSMLTGTWPHTHGVRDTFVTPEQTRLPVPALPSILRGVGYRSAIVCDWAGSDAEKFDFGFEHADMPTDQWNIKYLLRQGPKDLRLFLSLFTQGRLGKVFLPEVYYLGGIPLTEEIGLDTRRMIARLARKDEPFFIMSFMATTHPPFTSKHPYYQMFSDPAYRGESKFGMAKLRDPWEIIRRQGEPRSEFDLEQIIDLYDGCVRNFDDEVARVLDYLQASGLADDTIVVVYSDHGFEFFEHETWGQGNTAVGDFSARVPIIVADPRHPQPRKAGEVVRTIDLAPTLLELAGVPVPPTVEGVSLAPLLRGEPLVQELPAFYETGVWLTDLPGTPDDHIRYPHLPELLEVPDKASGMIALKPRYMQVVVEAKDRMVRVGNWKLSYQPLNRGALYKLFDIADDPGCQRDVLARYPDVAARLRAILDGWLLADELGRPRAAASAAGSAPQAPAAAPAGTGCVAP
ncbi:MAG: sulfatase-like hydrolase/transferase [Burkholderiales bacterium]|nr:sulfatase-like hydrolase/transferase [Burkholderiales bacterium]